MAPVKLAIVGCGQITESSHLPAVLGSSEVELVALVDADVQRARRLARKYGCTCEVLASLEQSTTPAEGVLIATPNNTHGVLARAALERGMAVLVEKPMATSPAEALELCEIAAKRNAIISVGFFTRQYPVVPLFKKLLDDGFFGRIKHFHFEYGTQGGWAPLSGYNLDRGQSGGGVLVVSGTHFVDRMLYWFGAPTSLRYADDSHGGVEANCQASFTFADGVTGSLFLSKTIELKNLFTLESERGRVEIPWSETRQVKARLHAMPDVELVFSDAAVNAPVDFFQAQIDEFARVIRHGGAVSVDGWAGAASVKLCDDLYAARTPLDEPWIWYRPAAHGVRS